MNIPRPEPQQNIPADAKRVFKGVTFDVYHWQQKLYDGTEATFEARRQPDSVTVIPVTTDKKIILLEQHQPSWRSPLISFPGGVIDAGEEPIQAAERELLEETGYRAERYDLWSVYQPVTKSDWALYTFIAHGCEFKQLSEPDAGERFLVRLVDFEDLLSSIAEDNFRHTDIAARLLKMHLRDGDLRQFKNQLGV